MERRSTKHGPRLDDELKREVQSLERGAPVEAHKEEFREHEGPGDGEPMPSRERMPSPSVADDIESIRRETCRVQEEGG